jgi:hypothetical protein
MRRAKCLYAIVGIVAGLINPVYPAMTDREDSEVVVPPDSVEFGNTYGEWSARWWQWLVSIPAATNPNLTSGIVDCTLGQSGSVWFLAGTFGDKPYTRSCTIPGGKDLLVTPLTTLSGQGVGDCTGASDCDPTQLRALAGAGQDNPQLLEVRVDNAQVKSLDQYRVTPAVYTVFFPQNAVFGLEPGTHGPVVSDGYFVLLKPLSPGPHTIHLKGIAAGKGFVVEVTYHLTVTK